MRSLIADLTGPIAQMLLTPWHLPPGEHRVDTSLYGTGKFASATTFSCAAGETIYVEIQQLSFAAAVAVVSTDMPASFAGAGMLVYRHPEWLVTVH